MIRPSRKRTFWPSKVYWFFLYGQHTAYNMFGYSQAKVFFDAPTYFHNKYYKECNVAIMDYNIFTKRKKSFFRPITLFRCYICWSYRNRMSYLPNIPKNHTLFILISNVKNINDFNWYQAFYCMQNIKLLSLVKLPYIVVRI